MLPETNRHLLLPWLCLLLLFAPLAAQGETERGLIYRISASPDSYLVGSIHVGQEAMYPLPRAMRQAYRDADTLVAEADIVGADMTRLGRILAERGVYQDGRDLEGDLSAEGWRDVSAVAKEYGMPLAMLRAQKPWLAIQTLTVLALQGQGYSEQLGVDRHFLQQAHDDGKRIVELEGLERQLAMLADMPAEQQRDMLAFTAGEIASGNVPMAELVSAWQNGEADTLQAQVVEQFPERLASVYRQLIVERNRDMATRVDELLGQNESLFVIVGAAHLTGPDGLVELLGRRGYSLEQM